MTSPLWIAIPVVLLTVVATVEDLRTRKVPNLVTGPALLLGVVVHLMRGGPAGALGAVAGAIVGGALLFPGWLMRLMGAGDVKLMAALGAWLGSAGSALYAVLLALLAGGILSAAVAMRRGILLQTLKNAVRMLPGLGGGGTGPPPVTSGVYVPKALAFMAGALFALCRPI
jgi:prepilin peptidase CpaA